MEKENELSAIIPIKEDSGKQVVSARCLYTFLEATERFQSWFDRQLQYGFIEGSDFTTVNTFTVVNNGAEKPINDYAMTISMAKEVSMIQRTDKGKEARLYFIKCESKLKELAKSLPIPQTYSQALMLAAKQAEQIEEQNKLIEEQKPKADFYDAVTGSKDAIDMALCAKTLNMDIGRNRLFDFLRSRAILDRNNIPFQRYIDRGYFRTIEQKYTKPDGTTCINIKTVVYQKGMEYIKSLIENAGK